MWNKIKKFFKPWPKTVRFVARDGNCELLATKEVQIYSWNEIIRYGTEFADEIKFFYKGDNPDEIYWRYEVKD